VTAILDGSPPIAKVSETGGHATQARTSSADDELFAVIESHKGVVGIAPPGAFANSCESCAHSTCGQTNCKKDEPEPEQLPG